MRYSNAQLDAKILVAEQRLRSMYTFKYPLAVGMCCFVIGFCVGAISMIIQAMIR